MEITPEVLRAASESVALLKSYVGVFQYFTGYAKFEGEAPADDPKLIPPIMGVIGMLDRETVDRSTLPTSAIWQALRARFIILEPFLRRLSGWSGDVPLHRFQKRGHLGKFFLMVKDMDRDEFHAEADSMYSELSEEQREFEIAVDAIYRERMRQQQCSTGLPVVDANTSMTSRMVRLSEGGGARLGYLGLIIDRDRREVSRVGYKDIIVKISGDADWQTFIVAYDAGERGASVSEWRSAYPKDAKWEERRKRKAAVQEKLSQNLDVAFETGELKLIPL